MRPYAERHGLTMLQLACQWNLAHPAVRCVAPTLIQESGADGRPPRAIEDKRTELAVLAGLRASPGAQLSAAEVKELRAIGDNRGCMALKGANPGYKGEELPDRWPLTGELTKLAARWEIAPERDLVHAM
jgi:hypothetical protein